MTQTLVNGLLLGATYALLAVGYTLVFGVMHLLTLAHGEVFMAAGVLALLVSDALGAPLVVAGLIAVAIGAALSAATDLVSFRPVGYQRPIAAAVSTIGLAIAIEHTVLRVRGSETAVAVPFSVPLTDWQIGPILVSTVQLASLLLAAAVMVTTTQFVRRSRWGMAMRAFAHDPGAVALLGVPIRRLTLFTLAIAGALAGIAAFLLALRTGSVSPTTGLDLGLTGLAVMTLGGLGSLPGAMAAGIGLGVVESMVVYAGFTGYQAAIPWVLLVVVLLTRPQGLFGEGTR